MKLPTDRPKRLLGVLLVLAASALAVPNGLPELKYMSDARCVRIAHTPTTPISGCYWGYDDNDVRYCAGSCYLRNSGTIYTGVCYTTGDGCGPYLRQTYLNGQVADCVPGGTPGSPNHVCVCSDYYQPYSGTATFVDCYGTESKGAA
ncbi:hypothetical protein EON81_01155 [bacterium]|nr:MAG: hypothetical protein EON81_01155 [bacterium]